MIENKKENQGFDHQESSEGVKKMSEKPFSSYSQLDDGKSKTKINGAPASSALGSGNSSVRVCDFCGRQFSSGKALGGHRRYHIQEQRKLEAQNQAQQEKVENGHQYPSNNHYTLRIKPKDFVIGGEDDDNDNNLMKSTIGNPNSSSSSRSFRCCICDKDFPSEKSLYGHMRSHPEREWRGMNPPFPTTTGNNALASSPSTSASPSSSAEELMKVAVGDHQCHDKKINNASSSTLEESSSPVFVDLSSSCSGRGWLKKDRRGRTSIGAAEAAETLMNIYYHRRRLALHEPPEEAAVILPVKKRKKNVKNHVTVEAGGSSSPAGKQSLEGSDGDGDGDAAADDDGERKDELKAADENNIWEMKVISLIKEQKLKKKKNKKMKLGPEIIKSEGELVIRTLKQEVVKSSSSQCYVCDICGQAFSSFQALGGHKSKHNRGKNIVISTKGKEVVDLRAEEEGEGEDKVCINNGALLSSSAGLLSCEEEGASLMSSEERLEVSSNNDNYENNSNNEEEMGGASNESAGSKLRDFDLNVPYVAEHEATDII